jgi:hypothetical protein
LTFPTVSGKSSKISFQNLQKTTNQYQPVFWFFYVFQPSKPVENHKKSPWKSPHLRDHLCRAPKPAAALDLPLGGRQLGLRKVSEQIHHGISRIFYDFFKDFDVFSMNLHGFH